MPLQSSGAISLVNIQTEFGGNNPIGLSEYYRGGTYVLSGAGNNINIPTSGIISLYNFYGTQAANFGSLSASVSTIAEGNSVTFTLVGGTGIPNGTYPWRVQGTNITALDISGGTGWNSGTLTGLFTITSNTGSFNVTTASDYSIEGTESIVALVGNVGDTNVVTPYITSGSVSITDGATFAASATNASLYRIGSASYRTTTINVTSTYTLQLGTTTWYWDVNGLDTGDIPATSGLFTMLAGTNPNSSGLFSIVATPVYLGEPSDKLFTVRIYTDASRTQLVATTPSLTLRAHGTISSVSWSPTSVNEGLSFSYTINTTNMPPNDLLGLYFNTVAILGTITTTDFLASGGALNGVLAGSTNGSSQIVGVLPTYMDTELEGVETFRLDFLAPDNATTLHTGQTLTIAAPTYNVTTNLTLVNEGSGVVITVYTTGVPVNTTLYWTATAVSGTINLGDLSSLTGNANVVESLGQYAAAFLILVTADSLTEGTESFRVDVYRDAAKTILVGSSPTITINDTSLSPPVYNSITPNVTLVNEGGTVTFTVSTSNVANGTTLYWSTNGSMTASDFSDLATTGSFTITSNSGTITRTLTNDVTTEGTETFTISVRTGSTSGTVQLTSSTITVSDTLVTPAPTLSVLTTPLMVGTTTTVNPGQTITYTWATTNATIVEARVNGGSWVNMGSTGSSVTYGPYTYSQLGSYALDIRATGPGGSVTQSYTYVIRTALIFVSALPTSISEGSSTTFTLSPSNCVAGWYYWSSSMLGADFTDGSTSGSFYYGGSGSPTITRTLTNDATTEGTEYLSITIYGTDNSTALGAYSLVTVSDTSQTPPPPSFSFSLLLEIYDGQYRARLSIYSNNLSSSISVSATAYYAVGANQPQLSCTNAYPALNLSGSGSSNPLTLNSTGWTNHTTAFTLVYYISISGAYSYSGYSNTTNVYL